MSQDKFDTFKLENLTLDNIPEEVLIEIFRRSISTKDFKAFAAIATTSKKFNRIVNDESIITELFLDLPPKQAFYFLANSIEKNIKPNVTVVIELLRIARKYVLTYKNGWLQVCAYDFLKNTSLARLLNKILKFYGTDLHSELMQKLELEPHITGLFQFACNNYQEYLAEFAHEYGARAILDAESKAENLKKIIIGSTPLKIKYILQDNQDIDLNQVDRIGYALIHYAADKSNKMALQLLIDHGADVNLRTGPRQYLDVSSTATYIQSSMTPLHLAINAKNDSTVECLLQNGANIHDIAHYRIHNCYIASAEHSSLNVLRMLTKHNMLGTDLNMEQLLILMYLLNSGALALLDLDYEYNSKKNERGFLNYAIEKPDIKALRATIPYIAKQDNNAIILYNILYGLVHYLSNKIHPEFAELLEAMIKSGLNLSSTSKEKQEQLMEVVINNIPCYLPLLAETGLDLASHKQDHLKTMQL